MKRIYLLLITIFCWGALWGQCPQGMIYLAEQSDVDNFALNYPGCTEILGELRIGGFSNPTNIDDLSPLAQITSVNGFLRISNTDIISLTGLENITSIGGLGIFKNDALTNLVSLENITSIDESISINRNDALNSLVGLENITSVGGEVFIDSNGALTSLAGLENLASVSSNMTISYNYALTSLTGLESITFIGGNMTIRGNNILTNLIALENISSVGGDIVLWYNGSLTSLIGLENISSIGGSLSINSNNNLTSLTGLENITSVGLDLLISSNESLTTLAALENMTSVYRDIKLTNNDLLDNLLNLNGLTSMEGILQISDNKSLKSLEGLDNLDYTSIIDLIISDNDSLSLCNITSVCNYLSGNSPVTINNNASECEDPLIVAFYCSTGDCPPSNLNFTSQQEIDDFPIDYPNCTNILGNIIIGQSSGTDITNLNGLSQLETIEGFLVITNNDSLSSLTGLENISWVEGLVEIGKNDNLVDLTGIANLTTNSNFYIDNNDNLTNLTGLENLIVNGDLSIGGNDSMTDLTGMEHINLNSGLSISNNDNLTSLVGLEQLTALSGYLTIINNKALVDLTGLQNLESIEGNFGIHNNSSDLTGLEQLRTIGGDLIVGYPYTSQSDSTFMSFSGLQSLDTIVGSFIIRNNTYLPNFTGLENLDYIGEHLSVYNNLSLENLSGLENFNYLGGSLSIYNNDMLMSLADMANLDYSAIDLLEIFGNPMLSVCNTTGICTYLENDGIAVIFNNASGCSSAVDILFICNGAISCLTEGITFTTQQQIDSFAINYPDCVAITGDVVIHGDNPTAITNLNGLSQIEYINGALIIQDNAALPNLNGLELLLSAKEGLDINNNDGLTSLSLLNLRDVQGELSIRNNALITGLGGIKNIFGLGVDYLTITDNPMLRYCSPESICNYLYGGPEIGFPIGSATVYGNVSGNYNIGPLCGDVSQVRANCPQYLPIELTTFQAQIQQKTALLTWQTATETHNEGFEIQRSKDGITWQKIGWQDGQGDTQTPHDYTYTDENPLSGTSYYRLKQIDFDGTFSHSDVVKVDYEDNGGVSIYPNPVKNTLHIADLNDNTIQNITIFDQMGRQITLQNTSVNTLDVSALSSGVYIIQVVLDSGVFSDRFIVK